MGNQKNLKQILQFLFTLEQQIDCFQKVYSFQEELSNVENEDKYGAFNSFHQQTSGNHFINLSQFFLNNKKLCKEWFSRNRIQLIICSSINQLDWEVLYHSQKKMEALKKLLLSKESNLLQLNKQTIVKEIYFVISQASNSLIHLNSPQHLFSFLQFLTSLHQSFLSLHKQKMSTSSFSQNKMSSSSPKIKIQKPQSQEQKKKEEEQQFVLSLNHSFEISLKWLRAQHLFSQQNFEDASTLYFSLFQDHSKFFKELGDIFLLKMLVDKTTHAILSTQNWELFEKWEKMLSYLKTTYNDERTFSINTPFSFPFYSSSSSIDSNLFYSSFLLYSLSGCASQNLSTSNPSPSSFSSLITSNFENKIKQIVVDSVLLFHDPKNKESKKMSLYVQDNLSLFIKTQKSLNALFLLELSLQKNPLLFPEEDKDLFSSIFLKNSLKYSKHCLNLSSFDLPFFSSRENSSIINLQLYPRSLIPHSLNLFISRSYFLFINKKFSSFKKSFLLMDSILEPNEYSSCFGSNILSHFTSSLALYNYLSVIRNRSNFLSVNPNTSSNTGSQSSEEYLSISKFSECFLKKFQRELLHLSLITKNFIFSKQLINNSTLYSETEKKWEKIKIDFFECKWKEKNSDQSQGFVNFSKMTEKEDPFVSSKSLFYFYLNSKEFYELPAHKTNLYQSEFETLSKCISLLSLSKQQKFEDIQHFVLLHYHYAKLQYKRAHQMTKDACSSQFSFSAEETQLFSEYFKSYLSKFEVNINSTTQIDLFFRKIFSFMTNTFPSFFENQVVFVDPNFSPQQTNTFQQHYFSHHHLSNASHYIHQLKQNFVWAAKSDNKSLSILLFILERVRKRVLSIFESSAKNLWIVIEHFDDNFSQNKLSSKLQFHRGFEEAILNSVLLLIKLIESYSEDFSRLFHQKINSTHFNITPWVEMRFHLFSKLNHPKLLSRYFFSSILYKISVCYPHEILLPSLVIQNDLQTNYYSSSLKKNSEYSHFEKKLLIHKIQNLNNSTVRDASLLFDQLNKITILCNEKWARFFFFSYL